VYLLSTFGGLGSRSRNGFGSFNILNRQVFNELGTEYVENILPTQQILSEFITSNLPSYTAFSNSIKLFKSRESFNSWDKALAHIGKIYKSCREKLENRHNFEKRQFLGAPLDPQGENFKSFLERRAKPYFMRVTEINGKYIGYVLYLPSKYCDGLQRDRNGNIINHNDVNQKFKNVCDRFNQLLAVDLEVIL
jgi:CRISPR-associated protein Cmr1